MIAWWLVASALAQDPSCTLFASADPARPGRVATGAEVIVGGALVIEADTIRAVGEVGDIGVSRVADTWTWQGRGCAFVDLSGRTVTPGLVAVGTRIGVGEIDGESETRDETGEGDPVRAALRVADAYNPRSVVVPVTRRGGVTSTVVSPDGGLFSGQAAWAVLTGDTQAAAVVDPSVAMVARLDGESRAEALLRLREVLDDAAYYDRRKTLFDENRARPLSASRLDLEALRPVLVGEQPLVVHADRAADIEAVLRLSTGGFPRIVIVGGAEAWLVADALAAADVPVVLDPLVYGPGSFDAIHGRADNAAILAEAGVDVILSTTSTHNARLLPQLAGNAVRGGLPWEDALRALTVAPADAFGQPDRGRLAPGAFADVVVWGSVDPVDEVDPFELSSKVDALWIGGRPISLDTRQTGLRDRYLRLPGTPLPPLPLPTGP